MEGEKSWKRVKQIGDGEYISDRRLREGGGGVEKEAGKEGERRDERR